MFNLFKKKTIYREPATQSEPNLVNFATELNKISKTNSPNNGEKYYEEFGKDQLKNAAGTGKFMHDWVLSYIRQYCSDPELFKIFLENEGFTVKISHGMFIVSWENIS